MGTATTTAREYLRVSRDLTGRERSTTEQQDDNRRSWPDLNFNGDAYADVSISASRYTTKARGGWTQLLDDLRHRRFGADVLVLWEPSRGSRRVSEWVELIDLCERHAVNIAVTTHGRTYDPTNARDRRSLLEDAVDSEYDSAKTSSRALRASAANAEAGRPHGGPTPFGYRRIYDSRTGALTGQEPHPDEAPIVRTIIERIVAGHSLHSICRDLNDQGSTTRQGKPWIPLRVRRTALSPAYVGDRLHRGEVIGPAVWPPLIDRATWLAAQRILNDPARNKYRPGRAKHLLSLQPNVVCDSAGCRLVAAYRDGRQYICNHVRLSADDLDQLVEHVILAYLARPENWAGLIAPNSDQDAALAAAREQVAVLRAELDELAELVGRGEVSARLAARAEPGIVDRLRAAEARERELSTPHELAGIIAPGDDIASRWSAIPIAARRRVVSLLVSPDVLGSLRVRRSPAPGRRVPVSDRVVWKRSET